MKSLKLEKLDSKQVPQVIILGVLCVGVLGYGAVTLGGSLGGSKPKPKPQQKAAAAAPDRDTDNATANNAENQDMALAGQPDFRLANTFNPDPFRPAAGTMPEPVKVKPSPKPAPGAPTLSQKIVRSPGSGSPVLPWLNSGALARPANIGQVPVVAPPRVPAAVAPPRPDVVVTGTSLVEGNDLAIIELGTEHRIVQKGDVVANNYRVERIDANGIQLTNGKDKFFVGVGASVDEKAGTAGGGSNV